MNKGDPGERREMHDTSRGSRSRYPLRYLVGNALRMTNGDRWECPAPILSPVSVCRSSVSSGVPLIVSSAILGICRTLSTGQFFQVPIHARTMKSDAVQEKKAAGAERDQLAKAFGRQLSMASRSVHADDFENTHAAVAPAMHVSTTFRYSDNPAELKPWGDIGVSDVRTIWQEGQLTVSSPATSMTFTSTRARSRPIPLGMRPS
jgi:hypothetical protein